MNRSGGPLRAALRQTDVDVGGDLLVVADDIDLPLGRIRLRRSGSAGGHNGLRDIIATLRDRRVQPAADRGRSRRRGGRATSSPRSGPTSGTSPTEMVAIGADAAERWLRDGIDEAMNAFNGRAGRLDAAADAPAPTYHWRLPCPRHAAVIAASQRSSTPFGPICRNRASFVCPPPPERRTSPRGARASGPRVRSSSSRAPTRRRTGSPTTSPRGSAAAHLRTLPERAALPLERALPEHDESAERLSVLADLGSGRGTWSLVGSLLALVQRTLSPSQLRGGRTQRARRRAHRPARCCSTALVAGGYDPVAEVTGIAEFAHRGGLVDAWPPGAGGAGARSSCSATRSSRSAASTR